MVRRRKRGNLFPPVEKDFALSAGLDELDWESIVERLGRPPNKVECCIFAALWSEEFANKSSSSLLESAELCRKGVEQADGSDIGLIDIGQGIKVALRFVANNSQCGIESRLAAETCADFSLQDLVVAGAEPIAILDLLRCGNPELSANKRQFANSVEGLSSYSNAFGVPIVGGDLYFHERFNLGALVNSCALALVRGDRRAEAEAIGYGSLLIYAGADTGREGLSKHTAFALSVDEEHSSGSTIVASDPLLASRISYALREAFECDIPLEVVSVGPGGLATASFRMANRLKKSVLVEVNRVPTGREGVSPLEILMSETSDRVLMAIPKNQHRRLASVLDKWNVSSLMIGEVVDSDGLNFLWNHYVIGDIPLHFALTGSAQKSFDVVKFPPMLKRGAGDVEEMMRKRQKKRDDEWEVVRLASQDKNTDIRQVDIPYSLEDTWLDLLADPNLCSRRALYERFDQFVGSNTLIGSGGDAALIRLANAKTESQPRPDAFDAKPQKRSLDLSGFAAEKTNSPKIRALGVTIDSNSLYVSMEPYLGTVQTVAEAMRNLAAVGAKPLGMSVSLNFGNPEDYRDVCDLAESIRGLGDASSIWKIPVMSKNVSLGNKAEGGSILPTPAIAMVGLVENADRSCRTEFKNSGDTILLIGNTGNDIGCSEYSHYIHHSVNRLVPDIDFDGEKACCEFVCSLIAEGILLSAHDLGSGGLALALAESCLGRSRPLGATLEVRASEADEELRPDSILFGETSGRFLISCAPGEEDRIRSMAEKAQIPITGFGKVGGKAICVSGACDCSISLQTAYKIWLRRIDRLFREERDEATAAA